MNNEPAFPSHGSMGEVNYQGMTLRDYFAAKAMQSIIIVEANGERQDSLVATMAYLYADDMLEAREAK